MSITRVFTVFCCLLAISMVGGPNLRMAMPPRIYATPGHEINLYFDNVVLTTNAKNYAFDVFCEKGRQNEARWTYMPKPEDAGVYPFELRVFNETNRTVEKDKSQLIVSPADSGAGKNVSILLVGDSLTDASIYPNELAKLLKGPNNPNVTFIGSHAGHGRAPDVDHVPHEGRGGWTWEAFCSRWDIDVKDYRSRSPFLFESKTGKPCLNFQKYLDHYNNGKAPDFIIVFLGCNDTFRADYDNIEEKISDMFQYADALIREFFRVAPQVRIGIVTTVPPTASQDGFGENYQCGQTRWQYRRNQHRVVERLAMKYREEEDSERIYLIPAYINLDCENNYPKREAPLSARNAAVVQQASNGVHPAESGYLQIADSIYYWLKYQWTLKEKPVAAPSKAIETDTPAPAKVAARAPAPAPTPEVESPNPADRKPPVEINPAKKSAAGGNPLNGLFPLTGEKPPVDLNPPSDTETPVTERR